MQMIFARLREPSTYAGLAVLLSLFGVQIAPEAMQAGIQAVSGLAGVAAIIVAERGR